MPKLSQSLTIPSGDVRMSVRPAGAVPSTGAPQASYPAGTYDFETHILIAQANPTVNRGAFPGRLSETLRDADINVGTAPPATISISAPTAASASETQAIGTAWNVRNGYGTWYSISGRVTAPATFQTANLNRAIARAFANTATFPSSLGSSSADAKLPRPGDGSLLLAALSAQNACTGGRDYSKVYAAACTRVGVAATLQPTTQGTANYTKTGSQGTANYTKTGSSSAITPTPAPAPRPPVVITTRPVAPAPAPVPAPPTAPAPQQQQSSMVPYIAAGGITVAVGLAIWKRKAIASWLRS